LFVILNGEKIMDANSLLKANDPDLAASFVALQRTRKIARDIAIQTHTGIVVMRKGKIVRLSAEELL
jgi:hypothetical protein